MLQEFKKFIARGNVMDLAVGIIIGAAFTAIVQSVVNDLINPIIGLIIGGMDFSKLAVTFGEGEHVATLAYGKFIMAVLNFFIIAWVVFLLARGVNSLKDRVNRAMDGEPEAKAPPKVPEDVKLLAEIRDLLKGNAAPAVPPAE